MGSLPNAEQPCVTLDQVIRRRAETHADQVLISYPANESDFVNYTGADLERLTRLAATKYAEAFAQLDEATRPTGPSSTVALVGVSSLEYYITFLALQRLGLTSMFISPRLADQGFTHLLKSTQCQVVVASGPSEADMERVRATSGLPLSVIPMLSLSSLVDHPQPTKPLAPIDDPDHKLRFIIHSGGTTGLPKPVPLLSASWLLQAAKIAGRMPRVDTLSTLPLFHSFGLATLLRCLVNGSRLSLLSASRPITAGAVLSGLAATQSRALVTVPYVLKFLAEVDDGVGVQRLAHLEQVVAAGSAVPDALGDALVVGAGVRLFHLYGLTECGALMEPCSTPETPQLWNWVRPLPDAEPFLKFEPVSTTSSSGEGGGETLYHLVVLPGLKAKVFADQPDGSYATKDLFRRHPTAPGANMWKFVARLDDIIVLVNGEKADPVPLEEAVGRNANVRAAVVFGAQRDALGMVVVAADRAAGLSEDEIVQSVLPDLQRGNERVPAYARIAPDALIVKPAGTEFPCTDKATVIRSLFLKQFAKEIDEFYAKREELANGGDGGAAESVVDDDADIRDLVRQTVRGELRLAEKEGGADLADDSDFFALGMDSLQATNVRSRLLKRVNLGGRTLATNVVFDHPSVELLTAHLLDVRAGQEENGGPQSAEELAMRLLEKYSTFDAPTPPGTIIPNPEKESIVSPLSLTHNPQPNPNHHPLPALDRRHRRPRHPHPLHPPPEPTHRHHPLPRPRPGRRLRPLPHPRRPLPLPPPLHPPVPHPPLQNRPHPLRPLLPLRLLPAPRPAASRLRRARGQHDAHHPRRVGRRLQPRAAQLRRELPRADARAAPASRRDVAAARAQAGRRVRIQHRRRAAGRRAAGGGGGGGAIDVIVVVVFGSVAGAVVAGVGRRQWRWRWPSQKDCSYRRVPAPLVRRRRGHGVRAEQVGRRAHVRRCCGS